jgi:transcriptional regulator with XRE-family HTH domain
MADEELRAKWRFEGRMSGEEVREIRKQAGLTLKQAAAALGLAETSGFSFVSEMERGERPVPFDVADRIVALVPLDGEPDSPEVEDGRKVAAPRGPYGQRSPIE